MNYKTSKINKYVFLSAIILVVLLMACNKEKDETTYPHELRFLTEEYKPLNYSEAGGVKGLAPEILSMICDKQSVNQMSIINNMIYKFKSKLGGLSGKQED